MRGIRMTALMAAALAVGTARAEVKTKTVVTVHDGVTCKGHLAWDDAQTGKRPGILVVHEWWGLNADAKSRAEQLAKLGYVAFAADMYGEGKVVSTPKEAGMLAQGLRKDAAKWEGRARAALKVLQDHPDVDAKKLASIGYCFGGSTSLMLANVDAGVAAVVSFHGSPIAPTPEQAKAVKARILVCNGADDAAIPPEALVKLKIAYDAGKAYCRVVNYPGARHSFTVRDADTRGIDNIRYNEAADRQSWADMLAHFRETFGAK